MSSSNINAGANTQEAQWLCASTLQQVQHGDQKAADFVCERLGVGLRCVLARRVPAHLVDDCARNVSIVVRDALKDGRVGEPRELLDLTLSVARKEAAASIARFHRESAGSQPQLGVRFRGASGGHSPDSASRKRIRRIRAALGEIDPILREILTRYYFLAQSTELICKDLRLAETQVRSMKSRAKAKIQAAICCNERPLASLMRKIGEAF